MKSTSGLSIWPRNWRGVRRERLDVAALALGVDRVERERGLPRAGEPGEDDEPVARKLERDVLEVVLAGAANDEGVGHGRRLPADRREPIGSATPQAEHVRQADGGHPTSRSSRRSDRISSRSRAAYSKRSSAAAGCISASSVAMSRSSSSAGSSPRRSARESVAQPARARLLAGRPGATGPSRPGWPVGSGAPMPSPPTAGGAPELGDEVGDRLADRLRVDAVLRGCRPAGDRGGARSRRSPGASSR